MSKYEPKVLNILEVQYREDGGFYEQAITGRPLDLVLIPREPEDEREQEYIESLMAYLVPGGRILDASFYCGAVG